MFIVMRPLFRVSLLASSLLVTAGAAAIVAASGCSGDDATGGASADLDGGDGSNDNVSDDGATIDDATREDAGSVQSDGGGADAAVGDAATRDAATRDAATRDAAIGDAATEGGQSFRCGSNNPCSAGYTCCTPYLAPTLPYCERTSVCSNVRGEGVVDCLANSDCSSGQVCCARYFYKVQTNFGGASCKNACATGESRACNASANDCPSGTQCLDVGGEPFFVCR